MFLVCNFEDPVAPRPPGGPTNLVELLLPLDHDDNDDDDDDNDDFDDN